MLTVLNYIQSVTWTTYQNGPLYTNTDRCDTYKPSQEILCILYNHTYKCIHKHTVEQKKFGHRFCKIDLQKLHKQHNMIGQCTAEMINR